MKLKKIILIIILAVIIISTVLLILYSTNNKIQAEEAKNPNSENTVGQEEVEKIDLQITDDYFLTYMSELYINYKNYKDKTISYEGFVHYDTESGKMVVGRLYYCCGYDAYITGLECNYSESKIPENQWVKVIGKIEIVEDDTNSLYPCLNVTKLEVLEQEGNKYVYN